jgi:peptide/nickel transport system permease protein
MAWTGFILRRLAFMVLVVFLVSAVVFIMMEVVPGDVARMILGQFATEEAVAAVRAQLGLDRPAWQRYLDWAGGVLRGDLGDSLYFSVPNGPLLARRLGNSLILAGAAAVVAIPISVALGVVAGLQRGRLPDHAIAVGSLAAVSIPEFVTGMGLVIVFAVWLKWLPPTSLVLDDRSPLASLRTLVLPVLTLTLMMIAYISRMTRSSMIAVMNTEYIRAAILKGLRWPTVVLKHALRNALLPTITVIAVYLGWLVGGLIEVETVFGYPGIGTLTLAAIKNRDVPLLEATVLVVVVVRLLTSLLADLLYAALNPRVRYT